MEDRNLYGTASGLGERGRFPAFGGAVDAALKELLVEKNGKEQFIEIIRVGYLQNQPFQLLCIINGVLNGLADPLDMEELL